MLNEIALGEDSSNANDKDDATSKAVLTRGCDPVMAVRAGKMLPPMIGGATLVGVTRDDVFFRKLKERKWDVVLFAPGACRYDAAKKEIPGSNKDTKGWTLEEYKRAVRELQGDSVSIVTTTDERRIVPLLRKALGL